MAVFRDGHRGKSQALVETGRPTWWISKKFNERSGRLGEGWCRGAHGCRVYLGGRIQQNLLESMNNSFWVRKLITTKYLYVPGTKKCFTCTVLNPDNKLKWNGDD